MAYCLTLTGIGHFLAGATLSHCYETLSYCYYTITLVLDTFTLLWNIYGDTHTTHYKTNEYKTGVSPSMSCIDILAQIQLFTLCTSEEGFVTR